MIDQMNLAFSNLCPARCVFCPQKRGQEGQPHFMSPEIAQRCFDEGAENGIEQYCLSENGEALMNPDFLRLVVALKRTRPNAEVALFSNFFLMNTGLSTRLLTDNLIQHFIVNIDGMDSYLMMKGLAYQRVANNLRDFLETREKVNSSAILDVHILGWPHYWHSMRRMFGERFTMPWVNVTSESDKVIETWRPLLRHGHDSICTTPTFGWAHRDLCEGDPSTFVCPQRQRIEHEAFIAPNGDWYICCLDERQAITFGNLAKGMGGQAGMTTLKEIYEGARRREILDKLDLRDYHAIGYPCTTIQACQVMR